MLSMKYVSLLNSIIRHPLKHGYSNLPGTGTRTVHTHDAPIFFCF